MAAASAINTFLRVRPAKKPSNYFSIDDAQNVEVQVPQDQALGMVNNKRTNWRFAFNGILDQKATQEEVRASPQATSTALWCDRSFFGACPLGFASNTSTCTPRRYSRRSPNLSLTRCSRATMALSSHMDRLARVRHTRLPVVRQATRKEASSRVR